MDDINQDKRYLVDNPEFPYCPGCGHTLVINALQAALSKTGKDPKDINIITDIGCVGLADKLFLTNTIHTTHGRSTAIATGLQLADEILHDGNIIHIIMIGDGGATIGLLHIVEAAKLNTNITVILHNNFLFGMTGGQHSGLTPMDFITSTTSKGNLLPPLRIGDIITASHSGFYSKKLAVDRDLDQEIFRAINYKGFALIEIIELCTGYATKWNKLTKKDILNILEKSESANKNPHNEPKHRETFGTIYKTKFPLKELEKDNQPIAVKREFQKEMTLSIIVSGSAGEGVQAASRMLCQAAVANGLNVFQQNDNPITIGTGFSFSQFIFSSKEIYYAAIKDPDYLIVTSEEGYKRISEMLGTLTETTVFILDSTLPCPKTRATVFRKPFMKTAKSKKTSNLVALGYLLKFIQDIPLESLIISIQKWGKNLDNSIEAVKTGYGID